MARVLLVEPYHGGSHRAWADGLVRHSSHEIHLVTHDAAYWRWRLRASALTLAEQVVDVVREHGPPDVLLVSDMVHLPALLGFLRRDVGDPAVALYVHENQLTHPVGPRDRPDEGLALANWLSMAVADRVLVNSEAQLAELHAAVPVLLGRALDHGHQHRLDEVWARTEVLPVGVELAGIAPDGHAPPDAPLVVWNHRWDREKRPDRLFSALHRLADEGVAFRLALAGENLRIDPQEFDRIRARLGERVVHVGALDDAGYRRLLASADVTASTAEHETFGIAAVEAMAAGCVPLLPNRLSYPEIVAPQWHEAVLYEDGELRDRLRRVLTDLPAARAAVDGLAASVRRWDWSVIAPRYDAVLSDLGRRSAGPRGGAPGSPP
jgi:glycosyltransferase involved in cell wall biosynthesis